MYFSTVFMYFPTVFIYFSTVFMYFSTVFIYFSTIFLYLSTVFLYFQTSPNGCRIGLCASSAAAAAQAGQPAAAVQCKLVPPLHSCSLVRMAEVEWSGDDDQNDDQDVGLH